MFTATLRCGTQLSYEERSFLPAAGDVVPCRRHGYCAVSRTGSTTNGGRRWLPRSRRRSQDELLEWLGEQQEATVHALRRQRFTLRLAAAAERAGLLEPDLIRGRVAVRRAPGPLPPHARSVSAPE
jgi:hypothetical protein